MHGVTMKITGLMFVLQVHCVLLQMETNHPLFHYVFAVLGCFTALFGTLLPELHTCKYSVRTAQ
jgi:formate hydrogenlyase subunit 3/multisubunit Na+/H+ antiporter MnhD subunit